MLAQQRHSLTLGCRDVCAAVRRDGVPHVDGFGGDVEVAAQREWLRKIGGDGHPPRQPIEPCQLVRVELAAHDPPVGDVDADHADVAAGGGDEATAIVVQPSGAGPIPATTSVAPILDAMATPFQRPRPWWITS